MWLASVKVSLFGSWITDFREGPQEALTGQRMKVVGTRVVAEELPSWMLLPAGEGRHTWPCTPLDLTSEAPAETGGGSLDLCSGRGPVGNRNGWVSLPHRSALQRGGRSWGKPPCLHYQEPGRHEGLRRGPLGPRPCRACGIQGLSKVLG